MRKITITSILISLCLINFSLNVSDVTKIAEDYCSKDSLDEVNYSEVDLENLREDRDNQFTMDYYEIINFLRDPSENDEDLWDAYLTPAILLLIFLVILLVSFIFYICLCCGYFKSDNMNMTKSCTGFAWILFIIFILLFLTILVFLGLS